MNYLKKIEEKTYGEYKVTLIIEVTNENKEIFHKGFSGETQNSTYETIITGVNKWNELGFLNIEIKSTVCSPSIRNRDIENILNIITKGL